MTHLTWLQAKQVMLEGKRVRNEHFTPDEWFEMRHGRIYAEDDCPMDGWYRGESWQDYGWSVIENV